MKKKNWKLPNILLVRRFSFILSHSEISLFFLFQAIYIFCRWNFLDSSQYLLFEMEFSLIRKSVTLKMLDFLLWTLTKMFFKKNETMRKSEKTNDFDFRCTRQIYFVVYFFTLHPSSQFLSPIYTRTQKSRRDRKRDLWEESYLFLQRLQQPNKIYQWRRRVFITLGKNSRRGWIKGEKVWRKNDENVFGKKKKKKKKSIVYNRNCHNLTDFYSLRESLRKYKKTL